MADRVSATDRVFAALRDAIVSGEIEPGSRHSIYRLAEEHDVSRTPVRDAVLRLADAGLVRIERNRGLVVRDVTPDDIREVFELRLLLEVPAAREAARSLGESDADRLRQALEDLASAAVQEDVARFEQVDRSLHAIIDASLGNERLVAQVTELRESIQSRGAVTVHRSRGLQDVLAEHVPLVEAVLRRDPEAAASAMRDHLVHTAALLVAERGGEISSMLLWSSDPDVVEPVQESP